MENIETVDQLLESYRKGQRNFLELDFDDGADLSKADLCGSTFEKCFISDADFSRANLEGCKFVGCNIKCNDFTGANLTNASIIDCMVEAIVYKSAIIEGLIFENNHYYGYFVGKSNFKFDL